jgi:hypothetical protein
MLFDSNTPNLNRFRINSENTNPRLGVCGCHSIEHKIRFADQSNSASIFCRIKNDPLAQFEFQKDPHFAFAMYVSDFS